MVKNFNWHRKAFSSKDYAEKMGIAEDERVKKSYVASDSSKQKRAYDVAADIRKFEITLFWHRAAFFWAFIAAVYTAYFNVLKEKFCSHGSVPILALSALGLFFCFSWLLSSKGSKHWQENWENHLDMLEDEVTGPLYKIYRTKSYSESKIAIAAGWVVTVYAFFLLLYEFEIRVRTKLQGNNILHLAFILSFVAITILSLFCYSRIVLGNVSNSGKILFYLKNYEEIS